METNITLSQDKSYRAWVKELKQRYLSARLKATVESNRILLEYYWSVGRDIAQKQYSNTYGSKFYETLSRDMQMELPDDKGFSVTNIKYMYYFYSLYNQRVENRPQGVDDFELLALICSIPWYHQRIIIDKCKKNPDKAIFFVRQTLDSSWSRDVLANYLKTSLYENHGKAVTNFQKVLPPPQGI